LFRVRFKLVPMATPTPLATTAKTTMAIISSMIVTPPSAHGLC
jgi:hypothetical protein